MKHLCRVSSSSLVFVVVCFLFLASVTLPARARASESTIASSCTPTVSADKTLDIPFIAWGPSYLSCKMEYSGFDGGSHWFTVTEATVLTDISGFDGCGPAVITNDLILHVPNAVMGGNTVSGDFQYIPTVDGTIKFRLMNYNFTSTVTAGDYAVAAGKTVDLTGDLQIYATGNVEIAGTIVPTAHKGQSVTIIADGNITISGSVIAGNGIAGGNAGSVTLISNNGNITLTDTARIMGGEGGAGQAFISDTNFITGSGGNGGSVTLKAQNGTITIPDTEGSIHIGSGGNGADVIVDDTFAPQYVSAALNKGGNAGGVLFESKGTTGLDYMTGVYAADVIAPDGTLIALAGATYYMINNSKPFSGGNGGNAGSVTNSAVMTASNMTATLRYIAELQDLDITGADGGNATSGEAGMGGMVDVTGKSGTTDGQSGQNVTADGGTGGSCEYDMSWLFKTCKPGRGGNADAKGGNGAKGADPDGPGGNGGYANAYGGLGGTAVRNETTIGKGGDAAATGGSGGDGGSGCGNIKASKGGDGGWGGYAAALGGNVASADGTTEIGGAVAIGGNGGNGGGGQAEGGKGGDGGNGGANGKSGSTSQTNGLPGPDGPTCPANEHGVPKKTDLPGTYSLAGTKTANDTCGTLTPDHITNPAVSITANGVVTVHSTADISGPYNETTGQFNGTGLTSDGAIRETISGYFSTNGATKLEGTLLFEYLKAPYPICLSEYWAIYTLYSLK